MCALAHGTRFAAGDHPSAHADIVAPRVAGDTIGN